MSKMLVEKWSKVLNMKGSKALTERKKILTAKLMEQIARRTKGLLKESAFTASGVEGYETVLIAMIRRMAPELIPMDIVGNQPMTKPSQLIFALRAFYSGARNTSGTEKGIYSGWSSSSATKTIAVAIDKVGVDMAGISAKNPTWTSSAFSALSSESRHGVLDTTTPIYRVTVADSDDDGFVNSITKGSVVGTVVYAEASGFLVQLADNADPIAAGEYLTCKTSALTAVSGSDDETIDDAKWAVEIFKATKVISNEILFNHVMKNYSGTYSTSEAESMKSFNDISFETVSTTVESRSRLLGARWSFEAAENMKAYFGNDSETELFNLITYEILAEMNRECRDRVITAATDSANEVFNFDYAAISSSTASGGSADARWHQEKFRVLFNLINVVSSKIAIATRRGPANFLIMSYPVKNALESMEGMSVWTDVNNNFNNNAAVVYTGTLAGKYKVYIDTFATSDFIALGYKGAEEQDAGLFYCPFIPLQAVRAVDPSNFQPRIGFRTRYGYGENPLGAHLYYRYINVENLDNAFGASFTVL